MNLTEYFVGGVVLGVIGFMGFLAAIFLFGAIWSGQQEARDNRNDGGTA